MPRQTSLSIEKQQRLYDTLKKIARQYMTPAQIARDAERSHGTLDRREYLEMAYENIQCEAKAAIKGMRRPEQAGPVFVGTMEQCGTVADALNAKVAA
jgi:hypothetical protein